MLSHLTSGEQSTAALFFGMSLIPILTLMAASAVRTFSRWSR